MHEAENKLQLPRGTQDIIGEDIERLQHVRSICASVSSTYGYLEIETPIMEFTKLFLRGLGESSDIISKEMYTFEDRSGDSITLRPEMTAPNVRALFNNQIQLPAKLFGYGPVFRYERPQKGRYRQFHQLNLEYFGAIGPSSDVENISLAWAIIEALGLRDMVRLEINSLGTEETMKSYKKSLRDYFADHIDNLSQDNQRRLETNTLRILDSKSEEDKDIVSSAPSIHEHYDAQSSEEFEQILSKLSTLNIDYFLNPRLVRGLDYYSGIVFEITTNLLGTQGTVLAGGRYDKLTEEIGGQKIPSVGFAAGAERISHLINFEKAPKRPIVIISMVNDNVIDAMLNYIRKSGIYAELMQCEHTVLQKTLKKAAQRHRAIFCIIIGKQEIQSSRIKIRNMDTGNETETTLGNGCSDEIVDICNSVMSKL